MVVTKKMYYYHDKENKGKCVSCFEESNSDKVVVVAEDYYGNSRFFRLPKSQIFSDKSYLKNYKSRRKLDSAFDLIRQLDEVRQKYESAEDTPDITEMWRTFISDYKDITFNGIREFCTFTNFDKESRNGNLYISISEMTPSDFKKIFTKCADAHPDIAEGTITEAVDYSGTSVIVCIPSNPGIWTIEVKNSQLTPSSVEIVLNPIEKTNLQKIINLMLKSEGYSFSFTDILEYTGVRYEEFVEGNKGTPSHINPYYDMKRRR